jgi:hypothetical protein
MHEDLLCCCLPGSVGAYAIFLGVQLSIKVRIRVINGPSTTAGLARRSGKSWPSRRSSKARHARRTRQAGCCWNTARAVTSECQCMIAGVVDHSAVEPTNVCPAKRVRITIVDLSDDSATTIADGVIIQNKASFAIPVIHPISHNFPRSLFQPINQLVQIVDPTCIIRFSSSFPFPINLLACDDYSNWLLLESALYSCTKDSYKSSRQTFHLPRNADRRKSLYRTNTRLSQM